MDKMRKNREGNDLLGTIGDDIKIQVGAFTKLWSYFTSAK
jgi:hypothetical protein